MCRFDLVDGERRERKFMVTVIVYFGLQVGSAKVVLTKLFPKVVTKTPSSFSVTFLTNSNLFLGKNTYLITMFLASFRMGFLCHFTMHAPARSVPFDHQMHVPRKVAASNQTSTTATSTSTTQSDL
jgi:hypothetical protein